MPSTSPRELTPMRVLPYSPTEMYFEWSDGKSFALPYFELRYFCPCASCVDEHTGARLVQREALPKDIRVTGAQVVGRYALQISFSDRHDTGMFHFDRLFELCLIAGRRVSAIPS